MPNALPKTNKTVSVQVFDSDFALLLPRGRYEIRPLMETRPRVRSVIYICVLFALSGIVGFGYFCPDRACALTRRESMKEYPISLGGGGAPAAYQNIVPVGLSYDQVLNDDFAFDLDAHDVIVFLHIQKTGGTSFGKHLVHDLDLERPCECPRGRKRCYCFRPHSNQNWLFSRYSTGWKCGLHADWTELTQCVDKALDENEGNQNKRRYFYVTLLREPLSRYLSEFRHVQRGATWKNSRHFCNGRSPTSQELPPCFTKDNWEGVDLQTFMDCESNLAKNRQTRMLADLSLVGCYNQTYMTDKMQRDSVLIASAKHNLASMAYFGLTEYQKISQYIFEETFNLRFRVPFQQHNLTVSSLTLNNLPPQQLRQVNELNELDVELYEYAKQLLFERFEKLKSRDPVTFQKRFSHLGEVPHNGHDILDQEEGFNWDKVIAEDASEETAFNSD